MTTPIRDDRDMGNLVRGWLLEDDRPTADRNRQIGRIMGRVDETRQRRRLWPPDPFRRRAMHSATGAERGALVRSRRISQAPAGLMLVLVVVALASTTLYFASLRPAPMPPGAAPGFLPDPADAAVFQRLAGLWAGPETSLALTGEVYAEDAVHNVLWLDEYERISGDYAMWGRMVQSEIVEGQTPEIRLPDAMDGSHRYLGSSTTGIPCVLWIRDERVERHDCVLPVAYDAEEWPAFEDVGPSAAEEREQLASMLAEAIRTERDALDDVLAPDFVHHVASESQHYTLEGVDEFWSVIARAPQSTMFELDLPAPEGELRWVDFSGVGGGSLCTFWARDGLVTRLDCIVHGNTTLPDELVD